MNKIEEAFLERMQTLNRDIKNYILSNKDWIFYFLNPLSSSDVNKPLEELVKEYPEDWQDYVDIAIIGINSPLITVNIFIDADGTINPETLKRGIYLTNFEETVKTHKNLSEHNLNDIRINDLKKEIETYKNRLKLKEKELNELLNNRDI